ncbi:MULTISPECIES: chlorophyll synthesis pathway protein BchC [unclassified Halorhodospira]|uniref:chlorophyll synthesis pathway protein BchC n=1 Tax=unclassified Halorhodospira TaxID=2626748 RepID=UPI001EE90701|nr:MULTISPECIES: chlorophyll synthesis pathway protein BchC [unclassified Halorhodospira]MCG5539598.1 chlorophyll synthesis pathway protein BchC [Halorhodospira sp. M39old]MCG5545408.1 chlorophyll synthesis pathway protein BchC [Halorhodospira sp. M38]
MSDPSPVSNADPGGPSGGPYSARAVLFEAPERLALQDVALTDPGPGDVVVDIDFSGISTGTERLLWKGTMPQFPGLAYPLVPGYESVGRVIAAGAESGRQEGEAVFVPGARCYREVSGLFGGAASRLVVSGERVIPLPDGLGERGVLLALAATAWHAVAEAPPDLVIGHGVLGRLIARIGVSLGHTPTVWETNEDRRTGADGYTVLEPDTDERHDYARICDVSGDAALLDTLIGRLAHGGEVVLAGFYSERLSFAFPSAFMREARLRVAAEWQRDDLQAVTRQIESGALSLDGLITHCLDAAEAASAYRIAFGDPDCLKMVLDWRNS